MEKRFLNNMVQAGIVVKDAMQAAKNHWDIMGIGPWRIYDTAVDPESGKVLMRVARAFLNGVEFELIEPNLECIHKTHLDIIGNSVHHLQFSSDDYDAAYQKMLDLGFPLLIEGGEELGTGGIRYAYFDTAKELGYITELAVFPQGSEDLWKPDYVYPEGMDADWIPNH